MLSFNVDSRTYAWIAHQQAYRLGILHRDISAGNILMSLEPEDRHGILVDWDRCILLNSDTKDRTGTRVHRAVRSAVRVP